MATDHEQEPQQAADQSSPKIENPVPVSIDTILDVLISRIRDRAGADSVWANGNGFHYRCPFHRDCEGDLKLINSQPRAKCAHGADESQDTAALVDWAMDSEPDQDLGSEPLNRVELALESHDASRSLLVLIEDKEFCDSLLDQSAATMDVIRRKFLAVGITRGTIDIVIEDARADRLARMPPPEDDYEEEARGLAEAQDNHVHVMEIDGRSLAKTYASLCWILRNDRRIFDEPLRWNEMACCPTHRGAEIDDTTTGRVREQIEIVCEDHAGKRLRFAPSDIDQALIQIAQESKYHPVKDYLKSLEWDRVPRIAGLCDILGVAPSPYHLAILKRWIVGCVARIFQPGCDLQMVLVLTGREDAGKSRFFAQLAGPHWFSDEIIDIKDKDAKMLLQRVWFWEWGELEQISAKDWPSRKSFITSRNNDFRTPYGKIFKRSPRHCVIPSTANEDRFLVGRDGERRFWPVRIPDAKKIKFDVVTDQRDQLWAEAVHFYRQREQWHLTFEEKALLRVAHENHVEEHPWQERVEMWLDDRPAINEVTSGALLTDAIIKPPKDWTTSDFMAISRVMRSDSMKAKGWVKGMDDKKRIWLRNPPQADMDI